MNFIKQLDTIALGSRLKSFSEIFFKEIKKIYKDFGFDFEPRWFTTVYLLNEKGKLSVTEIADEINQTHPSVNQIANSLEKKGLVESLKDKTDSRKRILKLSSKGKRTVNMLIPLWNDINLAAIKFLDEYQPDFMQIIAIMENALEERSMHDRVKDQIKETMYDKIKVLEYADKYKSYFKDLNYQWLEKFFTVEEKDKLLLNKPDEEIIKKGGAILFAQYEGEIVGTTAIIKLNETECEIAKMAVNPKFQGKQIGRKLLNEAIKKSKELKFKKIILLSAVKLTKAVNMYETAGFKKVKPDEDLIKEYTRKTIMMEMTL